jgi:signal transduction histidine kinase
VDEIEQVSRLRDEFFGTVSHELRTPLNSVLGWTQVLRQSPWQQELRVQALDAIERGVRAQTQVIEDLLDMSRIISGKLRLELQTVELMPLLQAAIRTIRPAAGAKALRLQCFLNPSVEPIKGDPARLQQIFRNLLSNAVKFPPKGGTIEVHLERLNSHAEVRVKDSGQGIAPEFLPNVFSQFSQAIPAVAVAAFAGPADRVRALQAGYNMHVTKPLEPHEILKVVAALVGAGSSK